MRLLSGRQTIRVRAALPPEATGGEQLVPLALEVQACDDEVCLAPAKVPLLLRLQVRAAGR